jgi:hypothetical protein
VPRYSLPKGVTFAMNASRRYFHKYLSTMLLLAAVTGCSVPTEPNKPYSGLYPATFSNLAHKNPLLAQELGKLPEIQAGISQKDSMALGRICMLYNQNQKNFDTAFDRMYNVGYPNIRKYCSPLQALYWLALEDRLNCIDISNYSLIGLLNEAWYKPGFEYDGTGRWNDFSDVAERLNSPELVDYYVCRNFSYKKIKLRSLDDYKQPHIIFSKKQGECWLYTSFCVYCLKNAGYRAHAITVYHASSRRPNHVACAYIDKDGKEYIMDGTLDVYTHSSGIYEKKVYLDIRPYYGKGYLTD